MKSRRRLWIGLGAAAVVAAGVALIMLARLHEPQVLRYRVDLSSRGTELQTVTIYYLAADSLALVPREREVLGGNPRRVLAQDLVTYLTESPEGLRAPLPGGSRLLNFFEDGQGEAVLNFNEGIGGVRGRGITEERLRLAALVRTVSENVGGVDRMRFLILGRPLDRWGSHLSLAPTLEVEAW